jgi:Radical SAM superfamily
MTQPLRVVILKPSKYTADGYVERFRWGFMPNSTVPYMRSMTPADVNGASTDVHAVDEYVHTDLRYLSVLTQPRGGRTLVALVGVQSHQFHRALDLAAYARRHGCMAVIGGPHAMTCDTSLLHGRGVSFALAEAELVWPEILRDAAGGELRPIYGREKRWQQELEAPVIVPPSRRDLSRYIIPMLGLYPARGCPFLCNFCSVTKIAGRRIRSQSITTTLASLRAARAAGVRTIMFTSDNFNKYPEAEALLTAMAYERLGLQIFVQCDTQIARQEHLVALLAKAGCFRCSSASNRSTVRPCWRPRRGRTVRRRTETSCGCAASTGSARTFPTSSASPRTRSRRSSTTWRCCVRWARQWPPSTSFAPSPAPSSTTTSWRGG